MHIAQCATPCSLATSVNIASWQVEGWRQAAYKGALANIHLPPSQIIARAATRGATTSSQGTLPVHVPHQVGTMHRCCPTTTLAPPHRQLTLRHAGCATTDFCTALPGQTHQGHEIAPITLVHGNYSTPSNRPAASLIPLPPPLAYRYSPSGTPSFFLYSTFSLALRKSVCVTRMRRSRSASRPASVHTALMSAPDSSSCKPQEATRGTVG